MKKNNFLDGAIIGTICLILCKILGLIYVIPFYKIIGSEGGALYSYAYSIYSVFLNLSTVGIPAAIAKIISEYDTLKFYNLKDRSYKIASNLLNYVGILAFLIMFIFSGKIAESIIGGVEGGNSVESVSIAIKVVSTALLIVPRLSILKGYFQGNKYITQSSYSALLEQLVRVIVIVLGSYLAVKVFHLDTDYAVYIAVFAATLGALSAYIYLKIKTRNIVEDKKSEKAKKEELKVSNKELLKKIIIYAIPFVIIALLQSAYSVVDTFTVVKTLTKLGYSTLDAETTISVISTWGSKLNMIVLSISLGITGSLIPNVVGSYTKGDFKDINEKLNLTFKMLLVLTIPMAIGISYLSLPVWHVFYGVDTLSSDIFRVYILPVVVYGLFTTITTITQSMNQTKITVGALVMSFLLKLSLNIPMMYLFKSIGLESYYATITTDVVSQSISLILVLVVLRKKYNFDYKELLPFIFKIFIGILSMMIVLNLLKLIYFSNDTVASSIITIIIYAVVGSVVYFIVTDKFKLYEEILGKNYKEKLIKKVKKS